MHRQSLRILASAALFGSIVAFAPLASADDKQAASAAPAADQPDSRIPAPPSGKGVVVFFRPWAYPGAAVGFSVHEGDTGVGKLGNNSYFIYVGDPGPHTFSIQSEATDTLHMEIDAGETYYVKETLGMGVVLYRPHLTPSDAATFAKLKGLKLSDKKPSDLKASADAKSGTN